jgi:hypothetical protein
MSESLDVALTIAPSDRKKRDDGDDGAALRQPPREHVSLSTTTATARGGDHSDASSSQVRCGQMKGIIASEQAIA